MSIQEAVTRRKSLTLGVAAALVIVASVIVLRNFLAGPPRAVAEQAYYTTDDGQTMFTDRPGLLTPFDHDGKPAYTVLVYTCDGGKTKFVAYLERYTSAAKLRLESQAADFQAHKSRAPPIPGPDDIEVKKPGSQTWLNRSDPQAIGQITNVRCPGGNAPTLVLPSSN